MNNEDALYLIYRQAAGEVVDHLLVVAMSGEAFDLGDLRFDTAVLAEDRDPLQAGLLNTRTEGCGFAITDNEDCAARVGYMVGYMMLDTSCLQHA